MATNEDLEAKKKDFEIKEVEQRIMDEDIKLERKKLEIKKIVSEQSEEDFKVKKKDAEFKLKIKIKNRRCFTIPLIFLLFIYSLALLGICAFVFFGERWTLKIDCIRLIFASILTLSLTAIIMFQTTLLKKITLHLDEE